MTSQQRIRLARRHAGLSQAALAAAVGVQRSAVSHWEATNGKHPSVTHMRELAMACGVQFEWLATGRGKMGLSEDVDLDSVAAADALLIEDPIELRLIHAFRDPRRPDPLAGAAGGSDRAVGLAAHRPPRRQPPRLRSAPAAPNRAGATTARRLARVQHRRASGPIRQMSKPTSAQPGAQAAARLAG
jgi:transcriptional regulator with XRE-family HTH domain